MQSSESMLWLGSSSPHCSMDDLVYLPVTSVEVTATAFLFHLHDGGASAGARPIGCWSLREGADRRLGH